MRLADMANRQSATGNWQIRIQLPILASSQWPVAGLLAGLLLSACVTHRPLPPPSVPPPSVPVPDVLSIPDPSPKAEPRAQLGNPPFYEVFGKRYFVLASSAGFVERGVASWYGPGFHKERTATGDPYDMYALTAAHKTLPLPCFARVTNLRNGRSVVVRINDRGPFKDDRIVDLSFTAASRLDMIRDGTALVELQVIGADSTPAERLPATKPLFVQAGAFTDEANAARLLARLQSAGNLSALVHKDVRKEVSKDTHGMREIHRVRIGPIATVEEFDRIVRQLHALGVNDARLASADESP